MSISNQNNIYANRGLALQRELKPKDVMPAKVIDDTQFIPDQFKEVARSMEEQFVQVMLEQMDRTVDQTDEANSAGMDYYKSLEKMERAKIMTSQNNLGLQNMVLDQIYPKRMRNEMALKHYQAQNAGIHQNLPSYKIDKKADTIEMRQNDSASLSNDSDVGVTIEDGGLHE